jgi:hypothetical protein
MCRLDTGTPGPYSAGMQATTVWRFCGREFTQAELEAIRALAASGACPSRAALSRAVCQLLGWTTPTGKPKTVSCRVALLRMQARGLVQLPPGMRRVPRRGPVRCTPAGEPQPPLCGSREDLPDLRLAVVRGRSAAARLWNELMARYHYLGYQPLPGAQLRYLVYGSQRLLGALGFGAAAWKVAARDEFIGWSDEQRQARLHLVVNNARFLLLPWVRVRNLASSVLALAARQLPEDWAAHYGYRPVLLETFVERQRFAGTSYKAANWICVGQTQGRGKLDRRKRCALPVKDVWLYPLRRDFREVLRDPR